MNGKNLFKLAIVVLNFPRVISNFITFAKAIHKAMANNPHFTASAEKVAKLNSDVLALDAAETSCHTKPPTCSVEIRDAAFEAVQADLRSLRNDVQEIADADPENAHAIINSASMSVKKHVTAGRRKNTVEDGTEEGSVDLTAEGPGPHEWRISTDGLLWSLLPASRTAKTSITGLAPGSVYSFQNRMMLVNQEKSEWSQSVRLRLK